MHTATQTPSRLGQFLSILEGCWTDSLLSSMGHSVTSLPVCSNFHLSWNIPVFFLNGDLNIHTGPNYSLSLCSVNKKKWHWEPRTQGSSHSSLLEDSSPCFHKFELSSRSVAPRVMYLVQYQPFWRAWTEWKHRLSESPSILCCQGESNGTNLHMSWPFADVSSCFPSWLMEADCRAPFSELGK